METAFNKPPHLLMWMVDILVIAFSLFGIGALLGSIPSSFGNAGDKALTEIPAPALAEKAPAARAGAAGNQIEKRMKTTQRYKTTVHFDDGSSRALSATSPQPWKDGDRVQVIDGVKQS